MSPGTSTVVDCPFTVILYAIASPLKKDSRTEEPV
jgi:hypothetical protein